MAILKCVLGAVKLVADAAAEAAAVGGFAHVEVLQVMVQGLFVQQIGVQQIGRQQFDNFDKGFIDKVPFEHVGVTDIETA